MSVKQFVLQILDFISERPNQPTGRSGGSGGGVPREVEDDPVGAAVAMEKNNNKARTSACFHS